MRETLGSHVREIALAELADRQFGVVSRRQLLRMGFSSSAIGRRVAAGLLRPLFNGTYAVGHTALRREGRWMAAVLACGQAAVLSHRTAAAVHGVLSAGDARVDISVPGRSGREQRNGIAVHRPRHLAEDDVTTVDGLPVTILSRTLVDLAEVVRPRQLERALAEAERLRLDISGLDRYATRHGAARVQAAMAAVRPEHAWTRSDLEVAVLRLCAAHDLPRPATNAWVAGMEVDFLWRDRRVVVEADGHDYHHTRRTFEDDHRRTLELKLAGYEILRFTDRQVEREPQLVVRALRAALGA